MAAHQTEDSFGDVDGEWLWSSTDFAALLQKGLPSSYNSPILVYAVSAEVPTFSSDLVAALRAANTLCGVTVYGFNKAIQEGTAYPNPQELTTDQSLNHAVVQC